MFQKCEQDALDGVTDNLMSIFDTKETGTVAFREVLTAFALSMKLSTVDKLQWAFR